MAAKRSIIIIGGDGQIGAALAAHARAGGHDVACTSRRADRGGIQLDLAADASSWPQLPVADSAIICAAITKLDACEHDSEATAHINITQTQALIEQLQAQGTHVVFLSTNQVFDGESPMRRADEPTSPRNAYGRQKAALEAWLQSRGDTVPAAILRLTKVIGGPLPIMQSWQEALATGQPIQAFDDLAFAPLPMQSVLAGIMQLVERRSHGIFQLSGHETISYADIARHFAAMQGAATDIVQPVSATTAGIPRAFLPPHGTLDMTTMADIHVPAAYDAIFGEADNG